MKARELYDFLKTLTEKELDELDIQLNYGEYSACNVIKDRKSIDIY